MTAQIDYVECAYRLAAAIYEIAEREAKGNFSHLYDDFTPDERWRKQQEAWQFCKEWREYFAQRLFDKVAPLPPPHPPDAPKKRQGGRRPAGQQKIIDKAHEWLRDHGPATSREVAEAAGCAYDNACKMLKTHPGRFRIVGERRNGPYHATLWDVKR